MTQQIASLKVAQHQVNTLLSEQKTIVLTGGCFDILHVGHIHFLTEAKKQGDFLIVLVESDETVKLRKGDNRPIHKQEDRAAVLAALRVVDMVIPLPAHIRDLDYDTIVTSLKPAIIATTRGDREIHHKKRQAEMMHAKVVVVTDRIPNHASSTLAQLLEKEL